MFLRVSGLVAAATLLASVSAVQAQVVQPISAGTDRTQTLPGWTLTGSVAVLNSNDYIVYAGGYNDTGTGNFLAYGAGETANDGLATPDLALTVGQSYTLSFDYGSFGYHGATQSLEVSAGGHIFDITTTDSTGDLSQVLTHYTETFVADSSTLSFKDISTYTGSVDGILANVSISATPEPATWALMMIGVGGMGAALRTRRRKLAA